MTRSSRPGGRPAKPRPVRDPYGVLPAGTPLAAVLSVVGLLLIAIATMSLASGDLPLAGGGTGPDPSGDGGVVTMTRRRRTRRRPGRPVAVVPGTSCTSRTASCGSRATGQRAADRGGPTPAVLRGRRQSVSSSPRSAKVWSVRRRWPDVQAGLPLDHAGALAGGDATRILDGIVDPPSAKWRE